MKIKDIINEVGFWSGVKQSLTPAAFKQGLRGTSLSGDAARQAANKLYAPDGELDWMTPKQQAEYLKRKAAELKPSAPTTTPPATPPSATPLHPDVSVTSSYPLRLRYKSGDYVLDPMTNQWLTVTGKKLDPTLSSFLQHQADRL